MGNEDEILRQTKSKEKILTEMNGTGTQRSAIRQINITFTVPALYQLDPYAIDGQCHMMSVFGLVATGTTKTKAKRKLQKLVVNKYT